MLSFFQSEKCSVTTHFFLAFHSPKCVRSKIEIKRSLSLCNALVVSGSKQIAILRRQFLAFALIYLERDWSCNPSLHVPHLKAQIQELWSRMCWCHVKFCFPSSYLPLNLNTGYQQLNSNWIFMIQYFDIACTV